MPIKEPRLRGTRTTRRALYRIGEFTSEVVLGIAKRFVYLAAVGHSDLTGDQWSGVFAEAIGGEHHASNIDTGDVSFENCAWSAKTVKKNTPFDTSKIRLISGRNSPTYSHGITDPFSNLSETGRSILEIWNARVDRVLSNYEDYRLIVLVRNWNAFEFSLFEEEIIRYIPANYQWGLNNQRNFTGKDKSNGQHCFTWQPHGGQFTIIKTIPASAIKFRVRQPQKMDVDVVLDNLLFNKTWLEMLP